MTRAQEIYCLTTVILTVLVNILVGYTDRKTSTKLSLGSYLQLPVVFYSKHIKPKQAHLA